MDYDYLIVGQGLAGSCLAYNLSGTGKKVLIINKTDPSSSSRVAAGLFNPVTGRRMVKTWKADKIFPYLEMFYSKVEKETDTKFLHKINIYRPFRAETEQREWLSRAHDEKYNYYISKIFSKSKFGDTVFDPQGGILLKHAGFIDLNVFLDAIKDLFIKKGAYLEEIFNINLLNELKDHITYKGIKARRIIFCSGLGDLKNPYFTFIPFRPVKGEIIEIETEQPLKRIYNRGVWVLPMKDKICKAGATYNHDDLTTTISDKGRKEIREKLERLIKIRYKIIDQVAGIRPAISDRRPVIGLHPEHNNIGILNGLGTKGVSLAPFFSKQFSDFLESGKELDREVDINRFFN